jgi:uncharacterized membrane protein
MAPLVVLITSFAAFRILGFGVPYFADWHHAPRAALGIMFLLTASAHWEKRRPDLVHMVPRGIGNAGLWVSVTGVAELAAAAGLQVPRMAQWAATAAIAMLCCLFPANMKATKAHLVILGKPVMGVGPRLGLQVIFCTYCLRLATLISECAAGRRQIISVATRLFAEVPPSPSTVAANVASRHPSAA